MNRLLPKLIPICSRALVLHDLDDDAVWVTKADRTPFNGCRRVILSPSTAGVIRLEYRVDSDREPHEAEFSEHHAMHFLRTLHQSDRIEVAMAAVQAKHLTVA